MEQMGQQETRGNPAAPNHIDTNIESCAGKKRQSRDMQIILLNYVPPFSRIAKRDDETLTTVLGEQPRYKKPM